jgi:cell division protein ZapE
MDAGPQPAAASKQQGFSGKVGRIASARGFSLDAAQTNALAHFERLQAELIESEQAGRSLFRLFQRQQPIRGLYLWGGVGRGKSFLMDSFFDAVPLKRKRRVHFHRFMQEIHHRLQAMQGAENPLLPVSRDLAQQVRLLCLDEFHVSDIGDAMLMRNLLEGLFEHGVVLVTTSNQHPDQLYSHGLQRSQFLPAIDLLKQQLDIVHVDGDADYRLRALEKGGVYHGALNAETEAAMAATFDAIADGNGGAAGRDTEIEIEGRTIGARKIGPGVAWFDFPELCDGPRGQADYIELARRFHTVLVSGVRRFSAADTDKRRRFTWLVDEFYDRRVKLILSGETYLHELFRGVHGDVETERTLSRLVEMQTRQYLSEPHLS